MDVIEPFATVCFVLAILGGALFLLKKRGAASFRFPGMSSSGPRRMEVLERVSLGPHHALHMVRLGGRCVVIATAPSACQLLCDAPAPENRQ